MTNKIAYVEIIDQNQVGELFGELDTNIKLIEAELGVDVKLRDNQLEVRGDETLVYIASDLLYELQEVILQKGSLVDNEIMYYIGLAKEKKSSQIKNIVEDVIITTSYGKALRAKTLGQKEYLDAIKNNGIVFGIGPAGTGKTYLAMAMAVKAFKNKEVNRIILTRPAVEAGESLGFLPGDLQEKIDPYLRPLYDALFEIMGHETYLKLVERGIIEVAPLAYMRGRTLDNSFIVLDEAQNTTNEQMKMFLTRLGYGSKAVITGDVTQVDLPNGKASGLKTVQNILNGVKGIEFVQLTGKDVVRHPIVQRIIEAYDKYDRKLETENKESDDKRVTKNETFNRQSRRKI